MLKRVLAFSMVLLLVFSITAQAAQTRAVQVYPSLSFSGTTATCKATVIADHSGDRISVTVKLWKGAACLKTWTASGNGSVSIQKTATVTSGQTYKLTVNATINGVAQPQRSITRTCP